MKNDFLELITSPPSDSKKYTEGVALRRFIFEKNGPFKRNTTANYFSNFFSEKTAKTDHPSGFESFYREDDHYDGKNFEIEDEGLDSKT